MKGKTVAIENKSFRYNTSYRWYKGNTHIHSVASDGGMPPHEIAGLYSTAEYDFLFFADHWVSSNVEEDIKNPPLLLLDGIELDGQDHTGAYFHVVCLGKTKGISKEEGLEIAIHKAREQDCITVLAHPRWTGNTFEDANRWNFDGVEIYNHVCHWLNGKSDGLAYWDAMLKQNPDSLGFSVDDAHLLPEHPGWDGGWIVVNAPELSRDSILSAIKLGNFYSSCGPSFKSITCDNTCLHIECSPVQFIRLVGPGFYGRRTGSFDGQLMTEASMDIPSDWDHAFVEIEDKNGKRAWSNTLFVSNQ